MKPYHKIQSIFKRNPNDNFKTFLKEYSEPEFRYLKDNLWAWTEKVDGTNVRVYYLPQEEEHAIYKQSENGIIHFRGKTDKAQIPKFLIEKLQETFTLEGLEKAFGKETNVCLYGEGYGARIQSGGLYIADGVDFILFDAKIGHFWLTRETLTEISNNLGIDLVPIVGGGTLAEAIISCQRGIRSTFGDFQAEGYVLKPACELFARNGARIITKVKCKDFK